MYTQIVLKRFSRELALTIFALLFSVGSAKTALANSLPIVMDTRYDGNTIVWTPIDSAIGYNIYRDLRYVDTVVGVTEYIPDRSGQYQVTAFDGNGNFSPLNVTDEFNVNTFFIAVVESPNTTLSAPQNVTGIVYSNNAGELHWDREPARSLTYSITNNGVQLGTTTGNSFWIDSLLVATENRITLTATTSSGRLESEATTLLFDTRGNVYPTPASTTTTTPVPSGELAAPQGLRIEQYASTIAELFWERPPASLNVVTTEVYRNNILLGTTPGISFYDDTRSPNTMYTYDLIAIDSQGNRSERATLNPDGFDGDSEEVVLSLLTGISEVATNNAHVLFYPKLKSLIEGDIPDDIVELESNVFTDNAGIRTTITTYRCPVSDEDFEFGLGTMVLQRKETLDPVSSITFEECDVNGELYYGAYSITNYLDGIEQVRYYLLDILDGDDGFDAIFMDGLVTTISFTDINERAETYTGFEYGYEIFDLVDAGEIGFISAKLDQDTAFFENNGSASSQFMTEMVVSAPWTGGREITVETTEVFTGVDAESGNYQVGQLFVTSENGETLVLSADSGDAQSWYAQLTTAEGSSDLTGNWGGLISLPCIVLDGEC